jgi:N-dimethylarginine dimethylaminohydrolase
MTPEGAILGRPASRVRAGEERWAARALSDLGVPILRSVRGDGTFEGADLMWLAPDTALLGLGLRTNQAGARQVQDTLKELGVRTVRTDLPPGTMHLMGQLRIVDHDLAVAWPGRLGDEAVHALKDHGFQVPFLPAEEEALQGSALNFVVLGPRDIVMPEGNPSTQAFYEGLGINCRSVEVAEIGKAAGSIGCMTGVLGREPAPGS